ncbi:CbtA family protein [Silvibacterium sp.]|uniref:CbtA family protein n=1 Tax=Silvibacterium sp. TaxID=1964179 RepID=UPI0039E2E45D
MTRILLVRGMLAGLIAGLLVFALARWVGEPQVERAIAFETSMDQARGDAPEPEIVSRKLQSSLGLLTATVVDGVAVGGIFALVFAFSLGRLPIADPRSLSVTLAGLGFVALAVVPALKYPANPPSVGNPDTIGMRTAAYFLLLAFSVVAMVLAARLHAYLQRRTSVWTATLLSAIFFVIVIAASSHFLPNIDEVPAGFPASLLWKFRVAALEMQLLLWSVLGFGFGWLADRALQARQPQHGSL